MEEIKLFDIKIPVYISESITQTSGLFKYSYEDMIDYVKKKIDSYAETDKNITAKKRNKPRTKEINSITYKEHNFADIPALLVRMNACTTNNYDMYIERDERMDVGKTDKIGSENHWLLLYPQIKGLDSNNYSVFWLIFVYADPNKEFDDITNSAKLFLKNILNLKFRNIKTPDVLKDIKNKNFVSELQVKYTSITTDENDVDVKFQEYLVKGKLKLEREDVFQNMPFDKTEELINEVTYKNQFQQKIIRVITGKTEYKILKQQQFDEAKEKLEDVVEETFNMTSSVTEQELEPEILYNEEFMISKLKPVVENYLDSYVK